MRCWGCGLQGTRRAVARPIPGGLCHARTDARSPRAYRYPCPHLDLTRRKQISKEAPGIRPDAAGGARRLQLPESGVDSSPPLYIVSRGQQTQDEEAQRRFTVATSPSSPPPPSKRLIHPAPPPFANLGLGAHQKKAISTAKESQPRQPGPRHPGCFFSLPIRSHF